MTFTQFNVEQHQQCNFDYLQIHDGPSASHHRIGKYCGTTLPNGGTINSTTHEMYMWFHSDDSIAHDGFTLTWRSALPGLFYFIFADSRNIAGKISDDTVQVNSKLLK